MCSVLRPDKARLTWSSQDLVRIIFSWNENGQISTPTARQKLRIWGIKDLGDIYVLFWPWPQKLTPTSKTCSITCWGYFYKASSPDLAGLLGLYVVCLFSYIMQINPSRLHNGWPNICCCRIWKSTQLCKKTKKHAKSQHLSNTCTKRGGRLSTDYEVLHFLSWRAKPTRSEGIQHNFSLHNLLLRRLENYTCPKVQNDSKWKRKN
jgi:hypothetical protein